jgi:hypothetical protein
VDLTGGSTALIPHSIGISITGLGHRVLDNDVIDSVGTLSFGIFASGLQLIPMQDSVIELNRISRVEFGIFVGQGVMIVGNRVSFTSTGIGTLNQAPQMVFLKDNLVRGSGPYLLPANYTDAGGNYPPIP